MENEEIKIKIDDPREAYRKNSYVMNVNTSVDDVLKECEKYEHVNNLDLQPLIDACPFKLNIKL